MKGLRPANFSYSVVPVKGLALPIFSAFSTGAMSARRVMTFSIFLGTEVKCEGSRPTNSAP
jgi:hypothetical protein